MTAIPPSYNYRYREVGRIPKFAQLNINKGCVVNDVYAYEQSQKTAEALQGLSPQLQSALGGQRKLLVVLAALGVGAVVAAVAISTVALSKANQALDEVKNLRDNVIGALDVRVVKTETGMRLAAEANARQDESIQTLRNSTDLLKATAIQQQNQLNSINSTIDAIARQTEAQFKALNASMQQNADLINAQFAASNAQTGQAFVQVYEDLGKFNTRLGRDIDIAIRGNIDTNTRVLKLAQDLVRQTRNIDIDRLTTKAYYQSLDKLNPLLKPFVLGQGIRPAGQLFGQDKRLLLDKIDINWVTNTTGNTYQIYNSQVRIYADSLYNIENARYVDTIDNLILLFGTNTCQRAYADADTPQDPLGPPCRMWVEVRTFVCTSTQSPKFLWTVNNAPEIQSSVCTNSPTALPVQIIKSFEDYVKYFQGEPCKIQDGPYVLQTLRARKLFQYPHTPQCSSSWKEQSYAAQARTGDVSLLYFSLLLLQNAFAQSYLDLFKLELQMYGRNPGGLKYERKNNDYVPTAYNGTTPIYDGAAQPVDCTYSSWLAVEKTTGMFV